MIKLNKLKRHQTLLFKTSIVFDVSFSDIFCTLLSEATLIITKGLFDVAEIKEKISNNINIAHFIPSQLLVTQNELNLKKLDTIMFSGEALYGDVIKLLPKNISVINYYGPTESGEVIFNKFNTKNLTYEYIQSSIIGKPFINTKAYVLYSELKPLPVSAIGELYISGVGLAKGYINNTKLTKEKFIPNPFQTEEEKQQNKNSRLYKTGDLVMWLPSGELEYIGRNDFQVKIRGFRIELGEIESVLSKYKGVKQVAVLAKQNKETKYLVAYYTSDTQKKLNEDGLLSYLGTNLPEYMIPTAIVHLDKMPITLNGKLDRKALPDPTLINIDNYLAPRNEIESKLCNIFASVLELQADKVGINDDFFKLGGNSILAIKLVNKVNYYYKSYLKVVDVFIRKNVKNIANMLYQTKQQYQSIVNLNISNISCNKPNLFMIHPGHGGAEVYVSLANTLHNSFTCYGIDSYNLYFKKKIDNLKLLSQYYLSHIEKVMKKSNQNHFYLLGWSLGGKIALEIASILETKGYKNITLYLLDTYILNKYTPNIKADKLEDLTFKEYMINKRYEKTYVDKVIANLPTERKLSFQPISTKLKYSNILLFKAMLKYNYINENSTQAKNKILITEANNINQVVTSSTQLKVLNVSNAHHYNILDSEEFLTKEIITFKNNTES